MNKFWVAVILFIIIVGGINLANSEDRHDSAIENQQQANDYQDNGNKDYYDAGKKIQERGTY